MRGDLLSGGTPKRLIQRDGVWTMQVVRQVAINRSIYRPHTQELEGAEVIMRYLKRTPQFRQLATTALQLLQTPPDDKTRSFDAVNGEWVPSVLAPSYIDELKRKHKLSAQNARHIQLLEVKAECMRLRNVNNALTKRVEELEKKFEFVITELEELKAREPVVVQAPAAEPTGKPAVAPVAEEHAPEAKKKAPPERDGSFDPINLPDPNDFIRCIEQLIGSDVTAKKIEENLQIDASSTDAFVSVFVDDNDVQVGAAVMDLKATVYLGGTLLMVPESELATQVDKESPSEDSIAASSEVCNALSGSINNVKGNPHIKSLFLEAIDFKKYDWLDNPANAITVEDSFGGRMMIVGR